MLRIIINLTGFKNIFLPTYFLIYEQLVEKIASGNVQNHLFFEIKLFFIIKIMAGSAGSPEKERIEYTLDLNDLRPRTLSTVPILKISPTPNFIKNCLKIPSYQTPGSVGMDVCACLDKVNSTLTINPGERKRIPTGLRVEIPEGYEIQTRPRSGISLRTSLLMVNSPGTLDADFRGETHIIMGNFGTERCVIRHGDRIAQWVFAPIVKPRIQIVETLSETSRGQGGFGSTGGFDLIDSKQNQNYII